MRLKHHMMSPCVSVDRYGPKQAYKHKCWVLESSRNFFTPPKGENDDCPKSLLGQLKIISALVWPEGDMKFEK